jgi:hypothetical protein
MILRVYFRVVKNAMVIAMEPFLRMATMTAHFMERPVQLRVADAVASDPSAARVPSDQHVLSVAPSVATNVRKRPKLANR